MRIRKILAICLSAVLFTATGCGASAGGQMSNATTSSAAENLSSESPSSVSTEKSSTQSVVTESASSNKKTSSKINATESVSSAVQDSSEASQNDSEWVAYDTNKDHYKLHIKRKDGSEDKVIVNDAVLAPCVASEWVYYIDPLIEIDKVKLDGSQKTKVCDLSMGISGSTAVTAEYKDGYILYTTRQMREVGDISSYPAYYYKLDPDINKITEVKNQ